MPTKLGDFSLGVLAPEHRDDVVLLHLNYFLILYTVVSLSLFLSDTGHASCSSSEKLSTTFIHTVVGIRVSTTSEMRHITHIIHCKKSPM
jgi:hypothetical protein